MDEGKIKRRLIGLRIIFSINLIARILNTVVTITMIIVQSSTDIIVLSPIVTWRNGGLVYLVSLVVAKTAVSAFCLNELRNIKQIHNDTHILINRLENIVKNCIINIVGCVFIFILGIFTNPILAGYVLGFTAMGFVSFFVGLIWARMLNSEVKYWREVNKYGSEEAYKEAIVREAIAKEEARQAEIAAKEKVAREKSLEKARQMKLQNATSLLEKIGRKFFVKYYEKLQNWSIPDLIDIIDENYSEEGKVERIKNAKKLFNQNLNVVALEIIVEDSNQLTDEETRKKAQSLLPLKTDNDGSPSKHENQ